MPTRWFRKNNKQRGRDKIINCAIWLKSSSAVNSFCLDLKKFYWRSWKLCDVFKNDEKKETCHTLRSPVIGYLLRGRLTSGSSRAGRRWRIQFVFFHVVIKHFLRFLDRIKDFLPIFAFTQVQARLSTSPPVWNQPSAPRHTVMYTAPKELSRWSIMERRATSFFFSTPNWRNTSKRAECERARQVWLGLVFSISE